MTDTIEKSPAHGVLITPSAQERLKKAVEAEGNPNLRLRMEVKAGGCAGLQYDMWLDENSDENDEEQVGAHDSLHGKRGGNPDYDPGQRGAALGARRLRLSRCERRRLRRRARCQLDSQASLRAFGELNAPRLGGEPGRRQAEIVGASVQPDAAVGAHRRQRAVHA